MPYDFGVREISGSEWEVWWKRAVAVYPVYAEYQTRTDRIIPIVLASRISSPQGRLRFSRRRSPEGVECETPPALRLGNSDLHRPDA